MRASLCIFIISLLISQDLCTKSPHIQFLESLRNNSFGKTLMQSLQLSVKVYGKNALDNIMNLLNQLLEEENKTQSDADNKWSYENTECQNLANELQSKIKSTNAQIEQNIVDIKTLNSAITNSQSSLDDANDQLTTYNNSLKNLVDNREAEKAEFHQSVANISNTLAALSKGKEILSKLHVSNGGEIQNSSDSEEDSSDSDNAIQEDTNSGFFEKKKKKKTVFAQFTAHVSTVTFKNKKTKYHGFVAALMALLSRQDIVADQNLVTQILNIIDKLSDQLYSEISTLSAQDNNAEQIFETQETNLQSEISTLNTQITDSEVDINNYKSKLADLNAENSDLSLNVQNWTTQLQDSQKQCSEDEEAYETSSARRADEISIIQQVLNIFQTKFINVQSYLNGASF